MGSQWSLFKVEELESVKPVPVTTPRLICLTARLIDSSGEGSSSEDTYQFKRVHSSVNRDATRSPAVDDSQEMSTAMNAEAHDVQFVNWY